jgi:hypothetical protein
VEAARLMWNKILLDPVHLVISSVDDDGLVYSFSFQRLICRSDDWRCYAERFTVK